MFGFVLPRVDWLEEHGRDAHATVCWLGKRVCGRLREPWHCRARQALDVGWWVLLSHQRELRGGWFWQGQVPAGPETLRADFMDKPVCSRMSNGVGLAGASPFRVLKFIEMVWVGY